MRVTLGQLRVQLDRATVLFRQVVENFDSEASCATSPSECQLFLVLKSICN